MSIISNEGNNGTPQQLPPPYTTGFYKGQHVMTTAETVSGFVRATQAFLEENEERRQFVIPVKDFQWAPAVAANEEIVQDSTTIIDEPILAAPIAPIEPAAAVVDVNVTPATTTAPAEAESAAEIVVIEPSPWTMEERIAIIAQHLQRVAELNDTVVLGFGHSTETDENGKPRWENAFLTVRQAITEKAIARLIERNDAGWNCYIAMNPVLSTAKRRTKQEFASGRNVFAECDEDGLKVAEMVDAAIGDAVVPAPSVILESSPGKFQFIWRIEQSDFTSAKIEETNLKLLRKFGCDDACYDVLRFFRLPALRNHKYDSHPFVKVVQSDDAHRYNLSDFDLADIIVGTKEGGTVKPDANETELVKIRDYFEAAAEEVDAKIEIEPKNADGKERQKLNISGLRKWGEKGYLWEMNCLFRNEHSKQIDNHTTVVTMMKSGALALKCHHGHCSERTWQQMRAKMEEIVGHTLRFGEPNPGPPITFAGESSEDSCARVEAQKAAKLKATEAKAPAAAARPVEPITPTPASQTSTAQTTTPQAAAPVPNGRRMVLISASSVKPKHIRWAWQNRFLANKPNVLYGEPGYGKGFIGVDFVARMTTGRDFEDCPNTNPPCDALICCDEDSYGETIVPRLIVAGADMTRIHFLAIQSGAAESIEEGLVALDTDLPALDGTLANFPSIRVVFIDPLATYMGELDTNKDKDCRPVYTKLARMAEKRNVCFVLIAHPNKNQEASAINKLSGAKALTTVFRNTWMVEKHPKEKKMSLMISAKKNLMSADSSKALKFHIEDIVVTDIPGEDGKPLRNIGKLVWGGVTDDTIEEVLQSVADGGKELKRKRKDSDVLDMLKEFLKDGARLATDFYKKAHEVDISEWDVRKARDRADVKHENIGGGVYWALSDVDLKIKRQELLERQRALFGYPKEEKAS